MDRSRVTLTFSGLKLTNGTSVWGSVAMAHSSMRICRALSVLVRFGEAAAVQVHRINHDFPVHTNVQYLAASYIWGYTQLSVMQTCIYM